jgi:hypothetical protein
MRFETPGASRQMTGVARQNGIQLLQRALRLTQGQTSRGKCLSAIIILGIDRDQPIKDYRRFPVSALLVK